MNRTTMCCLILSLLSATACMGTAPPASTTEEPVASSKQELTQVNVWHQTWNGGEALAAAWSPTSFIQVDAFETKSGKSRSASLSLWAYSYDPTSQVCQTETICWDPSDPSSCFTYEWCYYSRYSYSFGWGSIPNADFSVGKKVAELHTNLAKDTGFSGTTCDQDGVCGPLSGNIDVSWAANGTYSSSFNGTSESAFNFGTVSYTSRTTGQSSSASTGVSGQALGMSLDAASGMIGLSKGTGVSKDIFKN